MCTLFHPFSHTIDLPKDGVVCYRVVRLDTKKKCYTSVYPKQVGGIARSQYIPFKMGKKHKATRKYAYGQLPAPLIGVYSNTGFYVFKTFKEAVKQLRKCNGETVVRVRIYGEALEYTNGYRAEYMKIEAVCFGRRF
jgi:hypothetical protein